MEKVKKSKFSPAVQLIIIFGIISLLGDIIYEAARGANSQYLNLLGISAVQVGLVFGIGEFLGYFLRLVSGLISDKSGKHWVFMFFGYGFLLVVPIIGITQNWNFLIILILMERIGKALRSPAKDTIISGVAEHEVGIGFAFGLQEALDQIGAFAGPMIFTLVFFLTKSHGIPQYQLGYKSLIVPYIALMAFLTYAYRKIQRENLIPSRHDKNIPKEPLQPVFWLYTFFTFFCTLGFVNFSTIGYHLKSIAVFSDATITSLYAMAMVVDAGAALIVGNLYDRLKKSTGKKTGGLLVLAFIPLATMLLSLLSLTNSPILLVLGMVLFGIVMGTHETIMRSAIADITPYHKRGTGYGIFNSGYGLALMIGATWMGLLYDRQLIPWIIATTIIAEGISIVLFYFIRNRVD